MNLREYGGKVWTGCVWLRTGTGCYEHCNELSGSIKEEEFLDWLSDSPSCRTVLHEIC